MGAVIRFLSRWAPALADRRLAAGLKAYACGDYAKATNEFLPMAEQGSADAQRYLGNLYHAGAGVPQDYMEAVKWYRLAAQQGDESAQLNLGVMCQEGQGLPQDFKEAGRWFRLAADQGYAPAQFNLGLMYACGTEAFLQDDTTAMGWFRLAAEQGHADAQFNLGVMYGRGQGVPQDYVQAHMWFDLAGASGDTDGGKNREVITARLTPDQIAEARRLAKEWKPKTRLESAVGVFEIGVAQCCEAIREALGLERVLALRATDFKFPRPGRVMLDQTTGVTPAAIAESARNKLAEIRQKIDSKEDTAEKLVSQETPNASVKKLIELLRRVEDLIDVGTILGIDSGNLVQNLRSVHSGLIREIEETADQDLITLLLTDHSLREVLRARRLRRFLTRPG